MTQYKTSVISVGDFTVTVSKAGKTAAEKVQAVLEFIGDRIARPDQGLPPSPDQGLPDQGVPPKPSQGLPGQGVPPSPDQGLPGGQPGVDNSLPGGQPGIDNSLPGAQLGEFLKSHAKEIAAAVLKGTACDPAQPKR